MINRESRSMVVPLTTVDGKAIFIADEYLETGPYLIADVLAYDVSARVPCSADHLVVSTEIDAPLGYDRLRNVGAPPDLGTETLCQ
jgi:hypothetical protein